MVQLVLLTLLHSTCFIFVFRVCVCSSFDADNINDPLKKMPNNAEPRFPQQHKLLENYIKGSTMCMINVTDETVPSKYKRLGLHMDASDFISRGLYHGKNKRYTAAYYLFSMAFGVAKDKATKKKALANIGLSLMRRGHKLCIHNSFSFEKIKYGRSLLKFGEEKFHELTQQFPKKKLWADSRIEIINSWLTHICIYKGEIVYNFSWKEYGKYDYETGEDKFEYKTIREVEYNVSMEPLHAFLLKKREPFILKNSPALNWPLIQKMSWIYIQENLPRQINVNINREKFDLYSNGERKNMRTMSLNETLKIFNALDQIKSLSLYRDAGNLSFPYFMTKLKHNTRFKMEMLNDILDTPFHELSLCGDKAGDSTNCVTDTNLWLGARHVHAVAHYDATHNSYVQILGSKEFILAPPDSAKYLYFYPLIHPKHHRQSKIINLEDVNYTIFPKFRKDLLYKVTLEPGDVLSMPAYWIHQVKSLTSSIALNIWSTPSLTNIIHDSILDGISKSFDLIKMHVPYDDKIWKLAMFLELSKMLLLKLYENDTTKAYLFVKDVVLAKYYPNDMNIRMKLDDDQCLYAHSTNSVCPSPDFINSILPPAKLILEEEVERLTGYILSPEIKIWNAFDLIVSSTIEGFVNHGTALHQDISSIEEKELLFIKVFKCCLLANLI
jgi:hypothetical protein